MKFINREMVEEESKTPCINCGAVIYFTIEKPKRTIYGGTKIKDPIVNCTRCGQVQDLRKAFQSL